MAAPLAVIRFHCAARTGRPEEPRGARTDPWPAVRPRLALASPGAGILPRMSRPMVAAHRGYAAAATENTLAAFHAAIAAGADMIEFDVRRTRDGELIIFHDGQAGGHPVGGLSRGEIEAAAGGR